MQQTSKTREEILMKILTLETSEACQDTDNLTKIIKENADIFADILFNSVKKTNFPSSLKKANRTSVFKKGNRNSKDNFRPVSILPNIFEIMEQYIFCQL